MKAFCHIYAQWNQTRDRIADEARHLLDLGLTCDVALDFSQAARHRDAFRQIADAGGLCAPNIYPENLDPSCRDSNWWKYSEDECLRLLALAARRFETLDLGPLEAVNTYTPGNAFVAACRRSGVRYLLGFCAPTVIEDGGWSIAHYGSPLSPFFISSEDFRKPAIGDENAVLMASMELRNPMVCLNHWSEGPWCPLNAQAADRWLEPSADPLPFLQIAEDWLRQSELSGEPLFFHINLQYFFADRCYEHNRRALEWLAGQRERGRLEVGGLREWRKQLAAAGGFKRQTTYWRGEMMGFHVGHRPGRYPDVVVDESLTAQTIWQFPQTVPQRRYAYDKTWNYPPFEPGGSAPASEDCADLSVVVEETISGPQKKQLLIALNNAGQPRRTPLLLWNAFENWTAPFEASSGIHGWETRIVPHPAGQGGALLLEGTVPSGESTITVTVSGSGVSESRISREWDGLVCAETFFVNGRPVTYLVTQTPEPFVVEARVKQRLAGEADIVAESLIGLKHHSEVVRDNSLTLRFDGTRLACWHRLWNVTADEIEVLGTADISARLSAETKERVATLLPDLPLPFPVWQAFGNIRDTSRWDRQFAKAVGDAELAALRKWFASQRPDSGEVVIEVHPGLDLPRGSITKVLGHEFDRVSCRDGYRFEELCADYPQGWDWGVAAWVQWRQLMLKLEGLRPLSGEYLLHLHAFDPEGRDISQQVRFFHPEAGGMVKPSKTGYPVHQANQICAANDWVLPRGVEGRWHPGAICSIRIPDLCLEWPSIGVWIVPLEKGRLFDWVAEKGAPGMISHLWVTKRI